MVSYGSVLFVFFKVDFLSLRAPRAGWLSPSVVKLKEAVVEMRVVFLRKFSLIESLWHVALRVQVFRTDLGNVHINQQRVVAVNFEKLLLGHVCVNVVINVDVLVRKNHVGAVGGVTWHFGVVHLVVRQLFVFVNSKVEAFLCDDFLVGVVDQSGLVNTFVEFKSFDFLLNDSVNLVFDLLQVRVI